MELAALGVLALMFAAILILRQAVASREAKRNPSEVEPAAISSRQLNIVIGALVAIPIIFLVVGGKIAGDNPGPLFGFVFVVLVVVVAWQLRSYSKRYKESEESEERVRLAEIEEQRPHIESRLRDLEAGQTIDELPPSFKFRSQSGEVIYAAVPCFRKQLKSETTGVTYAGPAVRLKVVKGLYIRGAHYRGTRHKEDIMRSLGVGYLVITNKRLAFVAQDDGGNWVRRWASVVSWSVEDDVLIVEGTSGRPMQFDIGVIGRTQEIHTDYVDGHPKVLSRILEIASGEEPAAGGQA